MKKEINNWIPINKRKGIIKPLPKFFDEDVLAVYNYITGIISLGCDELYTIPVLWHEEMHKLLFETEELAEPETASVKLTIQWDNVAYDLERFLFNEKEKIPNLNYFTTNKKEMKNHGR